MHNVLLNWFAQFRFHLCVYADSKGDCMMIQFQGFNGTQVKIGRHGYSSFNYFTVLAMIAHSALQSSTRTSLGLLVSGYIEVNFEPSDISQTSAHSQVSQC